MAPTGSFIPILLSSILIFFVIYSGKAVASQTPPECQREVLHQTESIETLFRLHCNLRFVFEFEHQTFEPRAELVKGVFGFCWDLKLN